MLIRQTRFKNFKKDKRCYRKDLMNLWRKGCKIKWDNVSRSGCLTEEMIREFQDYLIWREVFTHQRVKESLLRELKYNIDYYWVDPNTISEDFIREMKDELGWYVISMRRINQKFFEEFLHKWDQYELADNNQITMAIAAKYPERVDWDAMIDRQQFYPSFFKKYEKFWRKCYVEDYDPLVDKWRFK